MSRKPARIPSAKDLALVAEAASMTPEAARRFIRAACAPAAYHESAHATIAHFLHVPPREIFLDIRRATHHAPRMCLDDYIPPPDPPGAPPPEEIAFVEWPPTDPASLPETSEGLSALLLSRQIVRAAGAAAQARRLGIAFEPRHLGGTDRERIPPERIGAVCALAAAAVERRWGEIERVARCLLSKIQPGCGAEIRMNREEIEACLNGEG